MKFTSSFVKQFIAFMLMLSICLLICSCNESSYYDSTYDSTTVATKATEYVPPTLYQSKAEALMKDYMSAEIKSYLLPEAKEWNSDIYSLDLINVASITVRKSDYKQYHYDGTPRNCYIITAKGTFWGDDEYGRSIDRYIFTWEVTMDYTGDNPYGDYIWYYSWSNNNVTVRPD